MTLTLTTESNKVHPLIIDLYAKFDENTLNGLLSISKFAAIVGNMSSAKRDNGLN